MAWLNAARAHWPPGPRELLPAARSLVVVGVSYRTDEPADGPGGRVARYAWGGDYHAAMKSRLRELAAWLAGARRPTKSLARLRRQRAAGRAGRGRPRGAGLSRQEHQPADADRLVRLSRRAADRRRARRRPARPKDCGSLPAVHRRLPDRRARRGVPPGRRALHRLSDDRAPRSDRRRASPEARRVDLRLRHVSGRVSLQRLDARSTAWLA